MSEKKPRLIYWEETCDAWVEAPKLTENLIDVTELIEGDEMEIRFRRADMTDEEMDALPEV